MLRLHTEIDIALKNELDVSSTYPIIDRIKIALEEFMSVYNQVISTNQQ